MVKIYHYTSIDTLEKIIKNKTIRFTRLDKVDDPEESIYGSGKFGVKVGKYIFVSCWTKDSMENPCLWEYVEKRYGKQNVIRIGMDENMFVSYPCPSYRQYKSFFLHEFESEEDCYFHNMMNLVQLYDVQYVDNNEERIKEYINDGRECSEYRTNEYGLYKNKGIWENQKESRFRLIATPTKVKFESQDIQMGERNVNFVIDLLGSMPSSLKQNLPISLEYKDMPLKEKALNSIEVTMGPNTTRENKKRVKKILYSSPFCCFLSKRRIHISSFNK